MTCYVDDVRHPFGKMIMCHLWADTLEELLEMVDKIGVQRKWIQGHPTLSFGKHRNASWVHFDIALSKKALAIANGAVLTDKYGPLEWEAKQIVNWKGASREGKRAAREKLKTIATLRERFGKETAT